MNLHIYINKYLYIWKLLFNNFILSLYNPRFYQKIYLDFKGFGFKYFLVCCLLASAINSCWFCLHFNKFANYLQYGTILSNSSSFLSVFDGRSWDKIFDDLPELEYDNKDIKSASIEKDQVFFINAPDDEKIKLIAIDLDGKLAKNNYPKITLLAKNIVIRPRSDDNSVVKIPYQIIYSKKFLIDGQKLKNIITNEVLYLKKNFLYKIFPIMLLINIYYGIIQNMLLIFVSGAGVYIVFKQDFSNGIRVALFVISAIIILKALSRVFINNILFIDYYSIFMIFNASRAVIFSQKNLKI